MMDTYCGQAYGKVSASGSKSLAKSKTSPNQRLVIRKVRSTSYKKLTPDDTVCCQPTS